MLLAVVMMLGMFPGTALAAGSVEEALGEVNIYNGEQKLSYLSINGRVRELIYTYYNYVDRNGQTKEIPAYCVNPNIKGVPQTVAPGESIKYLANEIGSDPKVMGIIANGYPHRSLSELKLENKYQAYYATKMALWAYLLPNWDINNMKVNPNLTGVELEPAAGYSIKDPTSQQVYVEAGRGKVVTFENTPLSAIIVKKVDSSTGDPLQGAWFRVRFLGGTSGTGGTVIAERQTSSNGTFILTGLKAGTYVVEEISAPDGYVLSENDIQTVYLSGNEQDVITVTFGNEAKGSVLIKKIDAITREPLSDVEFMVTESNGTVVGNRNGKYVTDSVGTILIDGLDPNTTRVIKEVRAKSG